MSAAACNTARESWSRLSGAGFGAPASVASSPAFFNPSYKRSASSATRWECEKSGSRYPAHTRRRLIAAPRSCGPDGNFRGQPVGSGTDVWKFWDDARAGLVGDCELAELECGIARSPGHCMTMGTASTMTSAAEALGMTLPGMASIHAVDSAHYRMAVATGRRVVDMAWEGLTPD